MQLTSELGTCLLAHLEPACLLLNLLGGGGNGVAIAVEVLRCDELWKSQDSTAVSAYSVMSMTVKALEELMAIQSLWGLFQTN